MKLIALVIAMTLQTAQDAPSPQPNLPTRLERDTSQFLPGRLSLPARWFGHHGQSELQVVDPQRLPQVFHDGVPSASTAGTYWTGSLEFPSLGHGRCVLYEPMQGPWEGFFYGSGVSAALTISDGGVLELSASPESIRAEDSCATQAFDSALNSEIGQGSHVLTASGQGARAGASDTFDCGNRPLTLALETDVQFSALFDDPEHAASWMTLQVLIAQDVLQRDLGLDLQVPYLGLHSFQDPWQTPDVGGNAQDLMAEFAALWPGLAPFPTQLSHFVSGAGNGHSLAGQEGICHSERSFGVHQMRLDLAGEPDARVIRLALLHGLGHNLGARHTHDYCPPLDSCNPRPGMTPCQEFSDCSTQGTIMSFCQLCPGGLDRVDLGFHPANVLTMQTSMDRCLPRRSPVLADAPTTRVPGEEWLVHISTPMELQQEPRFRYWGPSGQGVVTMTALSPGQYSVALPPTPCGEITRGLVWLDTLECGRVIWPEPGLQAPLEVRTSQLTPAFSDDMRTNRGWFSLHGSAYTGFWTRAIPLVDPDWPIAPSVDAGGDGWCFLTGNYWGNSDVDGGTTELVSPAIPVAAAPLQIEFEYFLGLINENGEDRLTLELSWNGLQGPWTPVWRSGFDTDSQWVPVTLSPAYLSQWPMPAPGHLHLRFLARDGSPPSIVEAAIDSVVVSTGQCP